MDGYVIDWTTVMERSQSPDVRDLIGKCGLSKRTSNAQLKKGEFQIMNYAHERKVEVTKLKNMVQLKLPF